MSLASAKPGFLSQLESIVSSTSEYDAQNKAKVRQIGEAIYNFVKQAQVNPGIPCSVDPGTHTGATTGPGKIS